MQNIYCRVILILISLLGITNINVVKIAAHLLYKCNSRVVVFFIIIKASNHRYIFFRASNIILRLFWIFHGYGIIYNFDDITYLYCRATILSFILLPLGILLYFFYLSWLYLKSLIDLIMVKWPCYSFDYVRIHYFLIELIVYLS